MKTEDKLIQIFELSRKGADLSRLEELCRPYLDRICPERTCEDWLQESYAYLLSVFFPASYPQTLSGKEEQAVKYFLYILEGALEREAQECDFDREKHFALLTESELSGSHLKEEYARLLKQFGEEHLYAFLRLSKVCTKYNILGHIAGVHYVSMYMARQLKERDVPLDLALMSGAALMHDIGKYGCRPEDAKKVPYLHYYYTYLYCRGNHLDNIGDIASNHSVWDLELENLSTESLLLIYADFRVKSVSGKNRKEVIRFWTLEDSYDVILKKLDNVDEAKKNRYTRVYTKLKDFENYMISLGCSVDLVSEGGQAKEYPSPVLMTPQEMTECFRELAISSNLEIMSTTIREDRFIDLLETIRSEPDGRHVRTYLTAIEEYSAYLPQNQKKSILSFLFDMLSHREGDIRRQAASIAGILIADYNIRFTKAIPEGFEGPAAGERMEDVFASFMNKLLHQDPNVGERERRYAGFAMKSVLRSLLAALDGADRDRILEIYIDLCIPVYDPLVCFFLMDGACELRSDMCKDVQKQKLEVFALTLLSGRFGEESRAAALIFLLRWMDQGFDFREQVYDLCTQAITDLKELPYSVRFMVSRIGQYEYGLEDPDVSGYDVSGLYLEDQRLDVPWIYKYVNLEILRVRQRQEEDPERLYQYASHLLHMLQFSDRIVNRIQAGENLLEIIPRLSLRQWHEIAQQLVSALEIGEYAVSKYIPPCLGGMYRLLDREERSYLLDQMGRLAGSLQIRSAVAALETVGEILGDGQGCLEEAERAHAEGILCAAMADYREEVAHEAFYVIGQKVFGSSVLSLEEKSVYFSDLARKILALRDWDRPGIYAYFNGVSLNRIYRFITAYELTYGKDPIWEADLPVAFFPGTFDPFSLGHKRIVEKIREMGFCVFLSVDGFSWSKMPQPFEIRRKIVSIATADMKEVYLFPEEIPVNLANPSDMRTLRKVFAGREVYIVAGSDVIENASAYRKQAEEGSAHSFPHILFFRNAENEKQKMEAKKRLCRERITGRILYMEMPPLLEEVSSTRIRDNINAGRDILGLIDERVQNYIYDRGLYTAGPVYKKAARYQQIDTRVREEGENERRMILSDEKETLCEILFHDADPFRLLPECDDLEQAVKLRKYLTGKTAFLTGIREGRKLSEREKKIAFNEWLEYLQENGYAAAICRTGLLEEKALSLFGFITPEGLDGFRMVDTRSPVVLIHNTRVAIRESMVNMEDLADVLLDCQERLQSVLAQAYPGRLILCFDSEVVNYRLMKLVTGSNQVTMESRKGVIGEKMCVPFGKVLKGVRIPETVTWALDTEKVYRRDLSSFTVSSYPGYAPLDIQIRTVRSFARPVIFVDDLYHSGERMRRISEVLKKEGVRNTELIVGVLSGRGQDLADLNHQHVEAAYHTPNLFHWLIETDLYPFIGGDGVEQKEGLERVTMAIPSINAILPYEVPGYLKEISMEALYRYSCVCLENARDIFRTLEENYRKTYGRLLTMGRIGEVIEQPRYPETIRMDREKLRLLPSVMLEDELEKLRRLMPAALKKNGSGNQHERDDQRSAYPPGKAEMG